MPINLTDFLVISTDQIVTLIQLLTAQGNLFANNIVETLKNQNLTIKIERPSTGEISAVSTTKDQIDSTNLNGDPSKITTSTIYIDPTRTSTTSTVTQVVELEGSISELKINTSTKDALGNSSFAIVNKTIQSRKPKPGETIHPDILKYINAHNISVVMVPDDSKDKITEFLDLQRMREDKILKSNTSDSETPYFPVCNDTRTKFEKFMDTVREQVKMFGEYRCPCEDEVCRVTRFIDYNGDPNVFQYGLSSSTCRIYGYDRVSKPGGKYFGRYPDIYHRPEMEGKECLLNSMHTQCLLSGRQLHPQCQVTIYLYYWPCKLPAQDLSEIY